MYPVAQLIQERFLKTAGGHETRRTRRRRRRREDEGGGKRAASHLSLPSSSSCPPLVSPLQQLYRHCLSPLHSAAVLLLQVAERVILEPCRAA